MLVAFTYYPPTFFLRTPLVQASSTRPPAKVTASASTIATIRLAIDATTKQEYTRAERLYRAVLRSDPNSVAANANLGLVLSLLGRPVAAATFLRKAAALEPTSPDFLGQAALILMKSNQFAQAIVDAKASLRIAPNHRPALLALGVSLLATNQAADAIAPLRYLFETGRGLDTEAAIRYSVALSSVGRLADAILIMRKQATTTPSSAMVFVMLGDLAGQIGFDKKDKVLLLEARSAYSKAFKLNPGNTRAGVNAGLSAEMAGEPLTAKSWYLTVLKKSPNVAAARHGLGRSLLQDVTLSEGERVRRARIEFEKAVAIEPKSADFLTSLAYSYLHPSQPDFQKASQSFRAALTLRPDDVRARRGLIDALWRSEQRDAALIAQESLAKSLPLDWESQHRLASMYQFLNKRPQYLAALGGLSAAFPKDNRAPKELGIALEQDGNMKDAIQALEDAVLRSPLDADALVSLGLVLDKTGKLVDAEKRYRAALLVNPRHLSANQSLLTHLDRASDTSKSLQHRRAWLTADPSSNDARWSLVQMLIQLKQDDEALKEISQLALKSGDPLRPTYRFAAASLFEQRERWNDAVTELSRIAQTEPSDVTSLRIAVATERSGQVDAAERVLETLLLKTKDKVRVQLALAGLRERAKRWGLAASLYEDLVTTSPDHFAALDGLIRCREVDGGFDKVLAFTKQYMIAPSSPPSRALLIATERAFVSNKHSDQWDDLILSMSKKFDQDMSVLQALVKTQTRPGASADSKKLGLVTWTKLSALFPGDGDTWFQLGRLRGEFGDRPGSILAYREAIKIKPNGPARSALLALGEKIP